MKRKTTKDFDWLDDPFDDKKMADEYLHANISKGTKILLGCVSIVIVIALVVLLLVAGVDTLGVLSDW